VIQCRLFKGVESNTKQQWSSFFVFVTIIRLLNLLVLNKGLNQSFIDCIYLYTKKHKCFLCTPTWKINQDVWSSKQVMYLQLFYFNLNSNSTSCQCFHWLPLVTPPAKLDPVLWQVGFSVIWIPHIFVDRLSS